MEVALTTPLSLAGVGERMIVWDKFVRIEEEAVVAYLLG
jgi:hypothetical protein